ncbi:MAG: hypothetical protein AAF597_09270 [Bacteroidota bacterium]
MHRVLLTLLLVAVAFGVAGQVDKPGRWIPGLRGGVATLPYERSVPTLATGA